MNTPRTISRTICFLLCGILAAPGQATDLADSPLINGSSITVLPNILFLLDDSLSMNRDYMPDYVHLGRYCRPNDTDDDDDDDEEGELEGWEEIEDDDDRSRSRSSSLGRSHTRSPSPSRSLAPVQARSNKGDGKGDSDRECDDDDDECSLRRCHFGDPPFMTNAFNKLYYNPMVNYLPPVDANGVPKISYSGTTPLDGYGVQFTDTSRYPRNKEAFEDTVTPNNWAWNMGTMLDLTKYFPERRWCTSDDDDDDDKKKAKSGAKGGGLAFCNTAPNTMPAIVGGNYIYPNVGEDDDDRARFRSGSKAKPPKTPHYQYLNLVKGAPYYYTVTVEWCKDRNKTGIHRGFGLSNCQSRKDEGHKFVKYSGWNKVTIEPGRSSYPGPNGTTRSYTEELTNFSNWFAWYRTRIQVMKTGAGFAFKDVRGTLNESDPYDGDKLHARIGFDLISDRKAAAPKFLSIKNFDIPHKREWYAKLYAAVPVKGGDDDDDDDEDEMGTPLRRSLSLAGRVYGGKFPSADPVQYSCQRNFAFLSSDGYWSGSGDDDEEEGGGGPVDLRGKPVGDQDGKTGVTRPSLDAFKKPGTLADGAYYYYHTDLRPGTCPNCDDNVSPAAGGDENVDDIASHQHMTTFTIGLGVDGTLLYQNGYRTSSSGDYYDIKRGKKDWPDPKGMGEDDEDEGKDKRAERIDDLWHAAVNGRGTYYSALDAQLPKVNLKSAIDQANGSGAATATSNLQLTTDDGGDQVYIANYRTLKWDGDLRAYKINLDTGAIIDTPTWSASDKLNDRITPEGNDELLPNRSIYTIVGGVRKEFRWSELGATEKAYFDPSKLSQSGSWGGNQQYATGESLVNYLRGHHRNEDQERLTSFGTYYRLYRDREKTLGDIVHSQPVYVKTSFYSFIDEGYAEFKADINKNREGTIYVASNDGMLHAFAASDGQERWAFIPPPVLKNIYRLADNGYPANHRFFVDGPIAVSDAKINGSWKTILVGALGKGGRGYYALDITEPAAPQYLWSFTADNEPRMGYSYGVPIITKLKDRWVVLVTSGYNNIPEGSSYSAADGGGYVWALDAATGLPAQTWSAGFPSVSNPVGLAHVNIKVDDFVTDNSMLMAYGGDLYGNMYRFALDSPNGDPVLKLGDTQPITSAPEIGEIEDNTVLFFGTGRYLGKTDLSDTRSQAIYAVKDKGVGKVSDTTNMQHNKISGNSINADNFKWADMDGWYMDLQVEKERVHLSPQLFFNTVLVPSVIPTATECQPGGYGRLYLLNFESGATAIGTAFIKFTSPISGVSVAKLPGGSAKMFVHTADGKITVGDFPTPPSLDSLSGQRVMWRELAK